MYDHSDSEVMMSVEPTDVFKFVSVRPVQLATEAETSEGVIRDERITSPGELRKLLALVHTIDSPEAAQQYREGLKLEGLAAIAGGARKLTERYRGLGSEAPPGGKKLISELGLGKIGDTGSREEAWNALYAGHAVGPDAGPLLEIPTAALRLLHYAASLAVEPAPSVDVALRLLSARPVIALQLDTVLRPAGKPPTPPTEESKTPTAPSPLAEQARQLAGELEGARALLQAVSRPSAAAPAKVEQGPPAKVGSWTEQLVAVDTTPPLQAVLGSDLPAAQTSLLDQLGISQETPLPVAASLLQEHLDTLSTEALRFAGNRDFEAGLLEVVKFPFPVDPPPTEVDPSTAADVDVHDRIKPLGFGDLKVVKQELLAYEAGEVSYIENVLKGETKSRVFRTLDRTETTLVSSEEEVKETERDTQATERFELKREAAQTIKEDESVKAGLSVTASYGPIVAKATGDFAYSTSKEESEKTSSDFAKEVVDKSISKVQTKVATSRTVNTINETEETDTHTLDNHEGKENDVGIYRWVDKLYRAQVYNYGTRMMLEFIVPQPAAFYLATHTEQQKVKVDATPPPAFVNDLEPAQPQSLAKPLTAGDITPQNYDGYAARYGAAGVSPPPPLFTSIGALLSTENLDDGKSVATTFKEFVVPTGYQLHSYRYTASILWVNYPKFTIQIGADLHQILADNSDGNSLLLTASGGPGSPADPVDGVVPVSVAAYDVHAYSLNVEGLCIRTAAAYEAWQLQSFEKIQTAYQALQSAYEQKVTQAQGASEGAIQGHNPALNSAIIATELKKLCITMMTGQHFGQFHAVTDPPDPPTHIPEVEVEEALREGPIVEFFEQAFEWEQMTYLFYPYFWGRKSRWAHIVGDVEDTDPSFEEFLTAGSCRVVVPVPLAYSQAVVYMLQSAATELAQKVWLGGEPPTLESPLYESIAEELQRQTDDLFGATPEGEPWEFKLPTSLVWLQPDSTLPVFT
jgi:hypothetical protein